MASDGLVRVTRSKFGKSREVPLHPSAAAALEEYARCRDELFPRPQSRRRSSLGPAGSPLAYTTVLWAFGRLLDLAGVQAGPGQPPARDPLAASHVCGRDADGVVPRRR